MSRRQYALIIPDGAGDRLRVDGRSPLEMADTPALDEVARRGFCTLVETLDPELPRGSLVAHLGLLGWDPRCYFPHGRASAELLALGDVQLEAEDLAFRANLTRFEGRRLVSYNADAIESSVAEPLVARLDSRLREDFPEIELHHNLDFRNSLVVRGAGVDPRLLDCPEPHEMRGLEMNLEWPIGGRGTAAVLALRLNAYLTRAAELLRGAPANRLMPWSASRPLHLPAFARNTGFAGRTAVVGAMDFLHGLARAGGMEFHPVGNGRIDTDYRAKGEKVLELLAADHDLVVCHVNAPDEAAHMGHLEAKMHCLEEVDRHVAMPVVRYFEERPERLGAVAVIPDHFTNLEAGGPRGEAHSLDPVPCAVWDGRRRDAVERFTEDAVAERHRGEIVQGLDFLNLLGITRPAAAGSPAS